MIPEELFEKDFKPLAGFYDYHVKRRKIPLALKDIQDLGVDLTARRQSTDPISEIEHDDLPTNTIVFSSSRKNQNVKNLMWTIRCLTAHPENIDIVNVGKKKCYKIICFRKQGDSSIPIMKGLISCDTWPVFISQLINKLKEINENDQDDNQ